MEPDEPRAVIVAAGGGKTIWVAGRPVTIKMTREATGGALSVFESAVPPDLAVPPHAHTTFDETFYILEGTFEFVLAEETVRATAGSCIHVPGGVCHGFRNVGATWGRCLSISTPAGMEAVFEDIGALGLTDPDDPSQRDAMLAIVARHDLDIAPSDDPLTV